MLQICYRRGPKELENGYFKGSRGLPRDLAPEDGFAAPALVFGEFRREIFLTEGVALSTMCGGWLIAELGIQPEFPFGTAWKMTASFIGTRVFAQFVNTGSSPAMG